MKTIFAIMLVVGSSIILEMNHSYNTYSNTNPEEKKTISCPPNYEKAEEALKQYLRKESTIEVLRKNYNMDINATIKNNQIYSLKDELHQDECSKLLNQFEWLEDYQNYSIYKVADHYFIVPFSITEKDEFEQKPITLINNKFEVVAVVIDF